MGESTGLGLDFLHPDEVGRTGYRATPGGVVVPHRISDDGSSPAFNKEDFLKRTQVNIIDGDQITSLQPGEADRFGNPIVKEQPCSSPLSETTMTAVHSLAPSPPLGVALAPSSSQVSPLSGASTPTESSSSGKKRGKQSPPQDSAVMSILQQQSQALLSLQSRLDSLTKSTDPPSTPPSRPASDGSDSPSGSKSSRSHKVRMESTLGSMAFEVLDARTDTEGLLVLVLDPQKPRFLPKTGQDVLVVIDEDKAYHCRANDLAVRLSLGGQEVLVVLLVLLETMTP